MQKNQTKANYKLVSSKQSCMFHFSLEAYVYKWCVSKKYISK